MALCAPVASFFFARRSHVIHSEPIPTFPLKFTVAFFSNTLVFHMWKFSERTELILNATKSSDILNNLSLEEKSSIIINYSLGNTVILSSLRVRVSSHFLVIRAGTKGLDEKMDSSVSKSTVSRMGAAAPPSQASDIFETDGTEERIEERWLTFEGIGMASSLVILP